MNLSGFNIRSKKILWIAASFFIASGMILVLLPYGIRYGVKEAFTRMGADMAVIEDVDFNPFTGKLAIKNIKTIEADKAALDIENISLEISWIPLFKKRIYINRIDIVNAFIDIELLENRKLIIGGMSPPPDSQETEQDKTAFGFGIDEFSISNSKSVFSDSEFRLILDIEKLLFSSFYTWKPEERSHVALTSRLNESPVSIDAEIKAFADTPSIKADVKADDILLKPFAKYIPPDITIDDGSLSLDAGLDLELLSGGNILLEHNETIIINRTDITTKNINVRNSSLKWDGKGRLAKNEDTQKIELDGGLLLEDLAVNDLNTNLGLVRLGSLELDHIELSGIEMITLDNIFLKGITLLSRIEKNRSETGRIESVLNSDALTLSGILLKDLKELDLEHIELAGLSAMLRVKEDGKLYLIDELPSSDAQPEAEKKKETSPFIVKIKNLQMSGKNSVQFDDRNITPNFHTSLLINTLSIKDIDSSRPDSESPYSFEAGIGDFTSIKLSGRILPFSQRPSFEVSGTINELNLSMLSPYTAKHLGYSLKSGHLNTDTSTKVEKGIIKSTNALVINKLAVETIDADKISKMTSMLTMPLDSALSLLRDKNDVIKLDLPVSGDINDPKFGLGDIINTAMGTAMKKAAMTYVKYIFQPYGSLISLISMGGDVIKLRLDPLYFPPGSAVPDNEALTYLENVAKILNERPDIELSLCGKTAPEDIQAMILQAVQEAEESVQEQEEAPKPEDIEITEEQKLELADQRALMIKRLLFEKYGIETKRLFMCNPEADLSEKSEPRVDLLL